MGLSHRFLANLLHLLHFNQKAHLTILAQDVESWNGWREMHLDEEIFLDETDLTGANLNRTDLHKAYLCKANLARTSLYRADLTNAKLNGAFLYEANLREADLHGADLTKADLTKADLTGANLTGANLCKAYLVQANLSHAIITNANLYGTARDDWKIEGISCEYFMFWNDRPVFIKSRREGKHDERIKAEQEWLRAHRIPKNHAFQSGEFEELYKSLPTLTDYFEQRLTPVNVEVMDKVVQTINEQQIVEFLVVLPNIDDRVTQRAFLQSAGLDSTLIAQLHVGEPSKPFMELLVLNCMKYGLLADGRHSLLAVMEAAKHMVGVDKQVAADALIQQITMHLQKGQEK